MDIASSIECINTIAGHYAKANITEDLAARLELLRAAQNLVAALKPPDMVVADMAFSIFHYASVRLALEMGIFEKLVSADRPLNATELATSTTADSQLVLRIARSLAGTGFLADAQTADGQSGFAITAAGRHAIVPSCKAGLKFHFDQNLPVIMHAPKFFCQNGFRIPTTQADGFFQHVYQTEDDCYSYWSKQAGVMENFNTFMQGYFGAREFVRPITWFPYDQVCFDGFDASSGSRYAYVDVGGGKGHHTQGVLEKYPGTKGVFMLQDIPQVIEDIDKTPGIALSDRIERLGHDFFQPQPVRGARTYVLDNVLHNWNDLMAQKILEHVRVAMKPRYSKLIVQGIVMPDADVPLLQSGLDLAMLFSHNGVQRSRAQWQGLLEAAGLRIIKFWTPPGTGNAMIEAEVEE